MTAALIFAAALAVAYEVLDMMGAPRMSAALTFASALAVADEALDVMGALVELEFRIRCARCRQVIEQ